MSIGYCMPPWGQAHGCVVPSILDYTAANRLKSCQQPASRSAAAGVGISSADGHRAFLAIIARSGSCADLRNSLHLTDSITSGSPHVIPGDLAVRLGGLAARNLSRLN
jgi:hypothetical protein